MKSEPRLLGKASLICRNQTNHERTGGEAVPVDYDSLTAHLQRQIFANVWKNITTAVIFNQHLAFDLLGAAGNTRKQKRDQESPLCGPHWFSSC
jgi:hypothetical protein